MSKILLFLKTSGKIHYRLQLESWVDVCRPRSNRPLPHTAPFPLTTLTSRIVPCSLRSRRCKKKPVFYDHCCYHTKHLTYDISYAPISKLCHTSPEMYGYENGLNRLLYAAKTNRTLSNISTVLYKFNHNIVWLLAGTCQMSTYESISPHYKGQLLPIEGVETRLLNFNSSKKKKRFLCLPQKQPGFTYTECHFNNWD